MQFLPYTIYSYKHAAYWLTFKCFLSVSCTQSTVIKRWYRTTQLIIWGRGLSGDVALCKENAPYVKEEAVSKSCLMRGGWNDNGEFQYVLEGASLVSPMGHAQPVWLSLTSVTMDTPKWQCLNPMLLSLFSCHASTFYYVFLQNIFKQKILRYLEKLNNLFWWTN